MRRRRWARPTKIIPEDLVRRITSSGLERFIVKIYVGNLAFETTEAELNNLFSQHGEVTEVAVVMDRMTGRSRGFGFVSMTSDDDARAAISALDGGDFGGRNLKVNEAKPKTESRGPKRDRW